MNPIKNTRGQIFTLDAFLALLIVTIALGLIVTQLESLKTTSSNELQTLSSDFAQIAVKRTLAVNEPNNLSSLKLNDLKTLMDNVFTGTNYEYEAEVYNGTISMIQKGAGCSSFNKTSITQKPAIVDGQEGYLKIKICK